MLSDFLININRLGCAGAGAKTLLAVSGGIDSVVMAELFREGGVACGIAHCNFRLRGKASDEDALSVRQLADRWGVTLHETSFDTATISAKWGMSTQMAARKLRYDWFEMLAEQHGYSHIATAHHAGDQVETVLLNLVRGSGLSGLRGMPAVNNHVIRPLLFATRERILEFATKKRLTWREDESNQEDYYRRNKIRLHVVPILKSINPSLESTVLAMTERLAQVEKFVEAMLELWKQAVVMEEEGVVKISIEGVRQAAAPSYQLYMILREHGFSYEQVERAIAGLDGISGKEYHSATHLLIKDRDYLLLTKKSAPNNVSGLVDVEIFERPADFDINVSATTAYFDAERLKLPLSVRKWNSGDSFKPYGMNGKTKKISDLLIDRKLDRLAKEAVRLVVDSEGRIIWVVGIRGDHTARITPHTQKIAKVTLSEREVSEIDVSSA